MEFLDKNLAECKRKTGSETKKYFSSYFLYYNNIIILIMFII